MKKLSLMALALVLSQPVFAAVHFNDANEMAPELRTDVVAAIERDCPAAQGRDVYEVETEVRRDRVDSGIIDLYYTSRFEFVIVWDQGVRDEYTVTVRSAHSQGVNAEADTSVESVRCDVYQVN